MTKDLNQGTERDCHNESSEIAKLIGESGNLALSRKFLVARDLSQETERDCHFATYQDIDSVCRPSTILPKALDCLFFKNSLRFPFAFRAFHINLSRLEDFLALIILNEGDDAEFLQFQRPASVRKRTLFAKFIQVGR